MKEKRDLKVSNERIKAKMARLDAMAAARSRPPRHSA
jgi:hypothetical protein